VHLDTGWVLILDRIGVSQSTERFDRDPAHRQSSQYCDVRVPSYTLAMSEDLESLGERIAEQAAHLDAALHRLLTDLRTFDRGGGWHAQGARSCAHWLSWRVGWGLGTAREHLRVADRLADLPLLDDALRRGEVSYAKLRAITRVATPANEAALLELARQSSGHQLETVCRKYRAVLLHDAEPDPEADRQRRWVARRDTADGMVRIEAVLHPEEAALVWAALDHRAQQQCREAQRVSAETPSNHLHHPQVQQPCREAQRVSAESPSNHLHHPQGQQPCREAQRVSAEAPSAAPGAAPTAALGARDDGAPAASDARDGRAPFDRADALVEIAQGYLRGDRPDRSPIELVVSVPAETLRRGHAGAPATAAAPAAAPAAARPGSADAGMATDVPDPCDVAYLADGTCVSGETARRLSCDCGVVEVVEGEHGAPLSVGRKRRTIPGSMKRALLQRDRTCRFPGCGNRLYLEAHHIVHWADGGETSLLNMLTVCSFHHRYVHEYGCSIELHADGPHFLDRRGRRILDAPPPSRPPDLGWEAILAQHAELQITASANEPQWDGAPIDHEAVIDALVSVEQAEAIQGWS
jgi:hypothetical protein